MDEWVRNAYRQQFCDENGERIGQVNLDFLRENLKKQRPDAAVEIMGAIKRLDVEICADVCRDCEFDEQGRFKDLSRVHVELLQVRTDLKNRPVRKKMVRELEELNKALLQDPNIASLASVALATKRASLPLSEQAQLAAADHALRLWIRQVYLEKAFIDLYFVGWKEFTDMLIREKPGRDREIRTRLAEIRKPGHPFSLESPEQIQKIKTAESKLASGNGSPKLAEQVTPAVERLTRETEPQLPDSPQQSLPPLPGGAFPFPFGSPKTVTAPTSMEEPKPPPSNAASSDDVPVAQQMKNLELSDESQAHSVAKSGSEYSFDEDYDDDTSGEYDDESGDEYVSESENEVSDNTEAEPDLSFMDCLITVKNETPGTNDPFSGINRDIKHAPLLSGSIVVQHAKDLLPQYGFIGCQSKEDPSSQETKVFQNTNVPFSAFVCGVQGSGKSHTTACMLENALLSCRHLGRMRVPASALVFSYGDWSSGGSGFDISEATFLAASNPAFPGNCVEKITVLVSPSNPAIGRLYQTLPNVEIVSFRLNAKALDIAALRTLMAVDDKATVPLYMAKVESILRDIASSSEDGSLNYEIFKRRLAEENFDPTQTNMLDMRLNLLESFLDLKGNAVEPEYLPGQITIMDLSDAFITPSTACILFKLGLDRFLQSKASAKMVVLDEAHKYMLDTPGSKFLTDSLAKTIRLQRHQGARVIISTQEPTVSTDLIALCSVTVIHRFTSPAWYAALKKHINTMGDDKTTMQQIEGLETGEALVYSPNAVLDKNDDKTLVKATGRLLKLNIRQRVTYDGGESIMAV